MSVSIITRPIFWSVAAALLSLPSAPASAALPRVPTALVEPTLEGRVNVNEATAEQLALLPGIGPATAAKIITYRARHPFRRPAQLLRVKGIGQKTYAAILPYIAVEGETDLREVR